MPGMANCPRCGAQHELLDPTFARPDPFVRLGPARQKAFAQATDDLCRIALPDEEPRWFVRCTLPVAVGGQPGGLHWGVWAEVDAAVFARIRELWDAAEQGREAPFAGRLANSIPGYPETQGLPLAVRLTGPETRPEVRFEGAPDHPFVHECRAGVDRHRAAGWLGLQGAHDPFTEQAHGRGFVCSHVLGGTHPVLCVVHDERGEWSFLCGRSHRSDLRVVGIGRLVEVDPSLRELGARLQPGEVAERADASAPWRCGPLPAR